MPVLTHIHIIMVRLPVGGLILPDQLLQLPNPQLIKFKFLLLFPQLQYLPFLLNSLLIQLNINELDFLLPGFLALLF